MKVNLKLTRADVLAYLVNRQHDIKELIEESEKDSLTYYEYCLRYKEVKMFIEFIKYGN